jgi:hypothetical protein
MNEPRYLLACIASSQSCQSWSAACNSIEALLYYMGAWRVKWSDVICYFGDHQYNGQERLQRCDTTSRSLSSQGISVDGLKLEQGVCANEPDYDCRIVHQGIECMVLDSCDLVEYRETHQGRR